MRSPERTGPRQRASVHVRARKRFSDEALDQIATRFKVLSEPMRLRLLNALRGREKSVTDLVEETGAGQANVSRHLGLLYRHRMVSRRKEGLNVYYRIDDPTVFEICEVVCRDLEDDLDARRAALS